MAPPSLDNIDENVARAFYEFFARFRRLEEKFEKHRHKIREGAYSEKPAW